MRNLKLAGDTVMDWITYDGFITFSPGGIGNMARGLSEKFGFLSEVTTVFNPLFPLGEVLGLSPECIQSFSHQDVSLRDYNTKQFRRIKQGLLTKSLTVTGMDAVVIHHDSCIREFNALYADVRTPDVRGECRVLRVSSTDNYFDIIQRVRHKVAIITHPKEVVVLVGGTDESFPFERVEAIDDIGAGDAFNVGFLGMFIDNATLSESIEVGIKMAQEKVQKVGVFLD